MKEISTAVKVMRYISLEITFLLIKVLNCGV
jgi:hypothetical protein